MPEKLSSLLYFAFEQERERIKEKFETVRPKFQEIGRQKQIQGELVWFCKKFSADLARACLFDKFVNGDCIMLHCQNYLDIYYETTCETVLLESSEIFGELANFAEAIKSAKRKFGILDKMTWNELLFS